MPDPTTTRGYLRSLVRNTLTTANTENATFTTGIPFTEGTSLTATTTVKGVWVCGPESRDLSETSESPYDKSGEMDVTIRVAKVLTSGEDVQEIGDAMVDAVETAFDSVTADAFTHPVTGVEIVPREIAIGLITPAHVIGDGVKTQANMVIYATLRYERIRP